MCLKRPSEGASLHLLPSFILGPLPVLPICPFPRCPPIPCVHGDLEHLESAHKVTGDTSVMLGRTPQVTVRSRSCCATWPPGVLRRAPAALLGVLCFSGLLVHCLSSPGLSLPSLLSSQLAGSSQIVCLPLGWWVQVPPGAASLCSSRPLDSCSLTSLGLSPCLSPFCLRPHLCPYASCTWS